MCNFTAACLLISAEIPADINTRALCFSYSQNYLDECVCTCTCMCVSASVFMLKYHVKGSTKAILGSLTNYTYKNTHVKANVKRQQQPYLKMRSTLMDIRVKKIYLNLYYKRPISVETNSFSYISNFN